jgi:hypothetical protein
MLTATNAMYHCVFSKHLRAATAYTLLVLLLMLCTYVMRCACVHVSEQAEETAKLSGPLERCSVTNPNLLMLHEVSRLSSLRLHINYTMLSFACCCALLQDKIIACRQFTDFA